MLGPLTGHRAKDDPGSEGGDKPAPPKPGGHRVGPSSVTTCLVDKGCWLAPGVRYTLKPSSSHTGDATPRVLRCTDGWTARWRAMSALGTWFALRSDEVGADRPANRVWLGEGGTQEGVVTRRD